MDKTNPMGLLEELGLSDLSDEQKEQLLSKMTEVILKRMFLATMDKLSEEDQEKYAKMLDNGAAQEDIESFLNSKIDNYDELLQKIVSEFKEEMKKDFV